MNDHQDQANRRTFEPKLWHMVPILVVVAVSVLVKSVFAIETPTSFRILNSYAYHGAFETGDMLFITKFNLTFDSILTELINESFVARLLDSGDAEQATTSPTATVNTDGAGVILGYGDAVVSFYLSAAEVTSLGLEWEQAGNRVIIQGSPSVYTVSLPTASSTSIVYRDQTQTQQELERDILTITAELDEAWLITLLDRTTGTTFLNATATDYWLRAIPGLNLMAPNIFSSTQLGLDYEELETGKTYVAELRTVLDGTPIDDGFVSLANFLSIPKLMVSTALLLALMGSVALYATKITGASEFGLLTVAVTLPLGALAGLTSLTFAAIAAFFCVLGMGYLFLYKPAS